MDLQNLHARHLVGQRDLHFAVQAPRPQQRRVEHVGAVGGHDHLDLAQGVKAVQLGKQLHERPLNFTIGRRALAKAATANSVDLVHENHAWLVLACVAKHFTDQAC